MARQSGQVQLEQVNMRMALNMGYLGKHGTSSSGIEETTHLITIRQAEIRDE
jgi:hypothetical protein